MKNKTGLTLIILLLSVFIIGVQADEASDMLWKGNAYVQMGNYDKAIEALDISLQYQQTSEAWLAKGEALAKQGNPDKALVAYDSAMLLDPNSVPAWVGKGSVYLSQKKFDQALSAYKQAILLDPKNAAAWEGKSDSLQDLGKTEESKQASGTAKELGFVANLS
jgi:tetratricopeptide (TPR) repeat protein